MFENVSTGERKTDRRVKRTRDILGDALIDLMREKAFDSITVQDVLDRAGVSRSTFYSHFSDKADLFLSDADDFFHQMARRIEASGEISHRVAPVREMFAHVAELGPLYGAMVASGKYHDILELAHEHFARGIEQRLARLAPVPEETKVSRAALAHALSGAMLSLMSWWLDHDRPMTPEQMDAMFHQMVWAGTAPKSAPSGR